MLKFEKHFVIGPRKPEGDIPVYYWKKMDTAVIGEVGYVCPWPFSGVTWKKRFFYCR